MEGESTTIHKLQDSWTLYLKPPNESSSQSSQPTEEEWVKSFHTIYSFDSVETFWKFAIPN